MCTYSYWRFLFITLLSVLKTFLQLLHLYHHLQHMRLSASQSCQNHIVVMEISIKVLEELEIVSFDQNMLLYLADTLDPHQYIEFDMGFGRKIFINHLVWVLLTIWCLSRNKNPSKITKTLILASIRNQKSEIIYSIGVHIRKNNTWETNRWQGMQTCLYTQTDTCTHNILR